MKKLTIIISILFAWLLVKPQGVDTVKASTTIRDSSLLPDLPMVDTFQLVDISDRPIIQMYVDGDPVLFLLDTGSGRSMIDFRAAKSLGFSVRSRSGSVRGVAGTSVPVYRMENVSVQSENGVDVQLPWVCMTLDSVIETIYKRTGKKVIGVIGFDFFRYYLSSIDFASGIIISQKLVDDSGQVNFSPTDEKTKKKNRKKAKKRNN